MYLLASILRIVSLICGIIFVLKCNGITNEDNILKDIITQDNNCGINININLIINVVLIIVTLIYFIGILLEYYGYNNFIHKSMNSKMESIEMNDYDINELNMANDMNADNNEGNHIEFEELNTDFDKPKFGKVDTQKSIVDVTSYN